jgi:hypothetical protein
MPRWVFAGVAVCLLLAAFFGLVWPGFRFANSDGERKVPSSAKVAKDEFASAVPTENAEPALPETDPPPGLPIIPWGKRDHFRAITRPQFVNATSGDTSLAPDENVLGLVVDNDIRAYSTNQLNEYEMVLDVVGGIPVLVTY